MATENRLNQIVKGAPPATVQTPPPAPLHALTSTLSTSTAQSQLQNDPHLSTLPSSPPQIYLNLLILESSLRAQYIHLLSRRRLNTFFLLILLIWNITSFYALFLRPREDGSGHGGSVYWVVEASYKLALLGGVLTALFIYITGQWERGVRWPRKWLGTTNRGLRSFNLRVVIVKGYWLREMGSHLSFLLPFGLWREAGGYSDWHTVEEANGRIIEEDLAPGGDQIKLLLLPKHFSPEFREKWEIFHVDYWEKENDRRSVLRTRLRTQKRAKASEVGGWKWWTGLWRLCTSHTRKSHDLEKHPHGHSHLSQKDRTLASAARRRSLMRSEESSHSRQSSRSSRSATPHFLDGPYDGSNGGLEEKVRVRRGSSSASNTARRKVREAREGKVGGGGGSARNSLHLSPLTSVEMTSEMSKEDTPESSPEKRKDRRRRGEREDSRPVTPLSDSGEKMVGSRVTPGAA